MGLKNKSAIQAQTQEMIVAIHGIISSAAHSQDDTKICRQCDEAIIKADRVCRFCNYRIKISWRGL